MQVTSVTPTTTTMGTTALQCISGFVTLFRFISPPPPGAIIGQLSIISGQTIPLMQTQPTPLGGIPLSAVDGQFATLCGIFVRVGGQTALDVRVVNPGAPSPTGTPPPFDTRLLLLLLLLLLLTGRLGLPGGTAGLGSLFGLSGGAGLSSLLSNLLNQPGLQSLLGSGTGSDTLATLLSQIGQRQV